MSATAGFGSCTLPSDIVNTNMNGNHALYDAFDQSVRMAPACFGLP